MKTLLCLLLAVIAVPTFAAEAISPADQVAQMKRGVNIVGYDPIWQDASKARFKTRHFKIIKDGGFDTVRIKLYGFKQMDEKLVLKESWFETLDKLVDAALEHNLKVILDEHDYEACSTDAAECRDRVLSFWTQVAERF